MFTPMQGDSVDLYDDRMAPFFLQILVQQESTQHKILREIDAGFTVEGVAPLACFAP